MDGVKQRVKGVERKNLEIDNRVKELESLAETELVRTEVIIGKVLNDKLKGWDKKAELVFKEIEDKIGSGDRNEIGGEKTKSETYADHVRMSTPVNGKGDGAGKLKQLEMKKGV